MEISIHMYANNIQMYPQFSAGSKVGSVYCGNKGMDIQQPLETE